MTPQRRLTKRKDHPKGDDERPIHRRPEGMENPSSRNLRSVWTINPKPYKGAHFAVFPPDLVRPCILAGTSEMGVCPECGMPWKRVMKRGERTRQHWAPGTDRKTEVAKGRHGDTSVLTTGYKYQYGTIRWQPTCSCLIYDNASYGGPNDVGEMPQEPYPPSPIPATVLDPFVGSGTTLLEARELERHAIGLDLSYSYLCEQASKRLNVTEIRPSIPIEVPVSNSWQHVNLF